MPDSAADRRSRRGSTQAIALALSLMAFCLAAQPLQQAAVATLQDDVAGHSVTFDEPLWVLPPSAIPDHVRTRPGVEPVRDRGYLDTPEAISGLPIESIDADSDRLHRDLDWNSCGLDTTVARAPARPPAADDDYTDLDAGGLRYRRATDVIEAVGGVTVTQGDQRIEADRLTYDRNSSVVVGPSGGYLSYGGVRLVGTGLEANLETEQGRVDSPTFRLGGGANARGSAETAYVVSPRRSAYSDIIYTTCPPGSNAWTLRANKLKLDQDKGFGTARDARLRLRGIPVAYTPYLRFPIDDRRRSGFLVPSFGTSDDDGAELLTPYYWNIAPEMDATFFPRIMSKRGVQLGTEFRYLSRDDKGSIRAEILPQDRLYDDGDTPRWALQLRERGLWFGRVRTTLDVRAVSDDRYLEDLGNNINATSSRRLRQFGEASYAGQGWFLSTRLEDYQSLDETLSPFGEPYSRLPQVAFRVNPRALLPRYSKGLKAYLDADYNRFQHDVRVAGERFTLTPVVTWPLRRSYGHLLPSARVYLSSYDLTNTADGADQSPKHAIPSLDVDGKLIFERPADWLGDQALQTFEPRVYYLYTPFEDQVDTPVFESSELNFSFSNLFRNNRFTGRDRIGDANQVTAALTSRMLHAASGEELWRVSLGQIYYFADRRVQIAGPTETRTSSPYTGELALRLFDHWTGRASFEWDTEAEVDQWRRRSLRLEYRAPEHAGMLNLAYRADLSAAEANRYEDADLSFRFPIGEQSNLEFVGRWLYSMRHSETMDTFAGVEFGSCCWRLRLLGRHFKRRPEDNASTSVMVQVELAGLGAIGDPIGEFLEREIYGYELD